MSGKTEAELEKRGGLTVTNVGFKSKAIKNAWCKVSKMALKRKKFDELQAKKRAEVEARKQVISDKIKHAIARMMVGKISFIKPGQLFPKP